MVERRHVTDTYIDWCYGLSNKPCPTPSAAAEDRCFRLSDSEHHGMVHVAYCSNRCLIF